MPQMITAGKGRRGKNRFEYLFGNGVMASSKPNGSVQLYLYPSRSSLHVRRQIRLQLPEDGASMLPRNTGTQPTDYSAPQRMISIFKSFNYILFEIVNVKMGSACSSEILRCISIRKAKIKCGYCFPV
jgi:hypothetical protein